MRKLLVALIAVSGCDRGAVSATPAPSASAPATPSATTSATTSASASDGDCATAFDPPRGGQLLCDEHVLAQSSEIHWRSFGVPEGYGEVRDRYRRLAASCNLGFAFKPPGFSMSRGDLRLEVHEPTETYPTCATAPQPSHRAIVIVSTKTERSP